jgi:phosphatidate cytidylyltransferase
MNESITRSLSGFVYVVLLVTATLFSEKSFLILFGVFLLISIYEFCNLIALNKIYSSLIGLLLYVLFAIIDLSQKTKYALIIATLFVSLNLINSLFKNRRIPLDKTSKYVYLLGYLILPIIILTKIAISNYTGAYQPRIIISLFILIWTNDTFAYIVGKSIGKTKLFESISPKKTVEGFIGGMVFAILAAVLIELYFIQMRFIFWTITAVIVAIFGTIGDLIESKYKRMAGVKDSGKIMPGHGGILDRLDSVIFVAPFIYLFLQIIQFFKQ